MDKTLLLKEQLQINCALQIESLFSDYATEFFENKVDNYKMVYNLYWQSILTNTQTPKDYLIIGSESHHHELYRDLNNIDGLVIRSINTHTWDFGYELLSTNEDFCILTCGQNPWTTPKYSTSEITALREIWPESLTLPWKTSQDHLASPEFLNQYDDQLVVAEKDGHAKVRRTFHNCNKTLSRIDVDSVHQLSERKIKNYYEFSNGWGLGLCRITHTSDKKRSLRLSHFRYTGQSIDFFLARHISDWLLKLLEEEPFEKWQGDGHIYLSAGHPIILGFLQKFLAGTLNTPLKNFYLTDILFGRNFSVSYLSFFKDNSAGIFIDMNHFPDIYIWQMSKV